MKNREQTSFAAVEVRVNAIIDSFNAKTKGVAGAQYATLARRTEAKVEKILASAGWTRASFNAESERINDADA